MSEYWLFIKFLFYSMIVLIVVISGLIIFILAIAFSG